jgi:hypothetical protein
MKSKTPSAALLVKIYLKLSVAWSIFGKQFLVIAEKPMKISWQALTPWLHWRACLRSSWRTGPGYSAAARQRENQTNA